MTQSVTDDTTPDVAVEPPVGTVILFRVRHQPGEISYMFAAVRYEYTWHTTARGTTRKRMKWANLIALMRESVDDPGYQILEASPEFVHV